MSILSFLTRLETNLTISINSFESVNKNGVADKYKLYETIQKNSSLMYKYLEYLKQLEYLYFAQNIEEKDKFLLSFDLDADLYDKNFKKRFKDDNKVQINIHKLKESTKNNTVPILENIDIEALETTELSPNKLNLPVISNLKDIPQMFYWYTGDSVYKKGVYTCMAPGFVVKVPFPNVVSTSSTNFKINSTPCQYETKEACMAKKKRISEIHNSEVRGCSYVHRKERFEKIGPIYRCTVDTLGCHETLDKDMDYTTISDIKRILMYSLSDSLLSTLWYQNRFKDGNIVLNNIDIY